MQKRFYVQCPSFPDAILYILCGLGSIKWNKMCFAQICTISRPLFPSWKLRLAMSPCTPPVVRGLEWGRSSWHNMQCTIAWRQWSSRLPEHPLKCGWGTREFVFEGLSATLKIYVMCEVELFFHSLIFSRGPSMCSGVGLEIHRDVSIAAALTELFEGVRQTPSGWWWGLKPPALAVWTQGEPYPEGTALPGP